MNWYIIIPVAAILVALIIFLIVRNAKDEKEFEKELDHDDSKPDTEEADAPTDNAAPVK
ncbi:MAG: hypothetical protein ABJA78_18210 [Ferruginibacter sp.]